MSQPTAQTKAVFGVRDSHVSATQANGAPARAKAVKARVRTGTEVPRADVARRGKSATFLPCDIEEGRAALPDLSQAPDLTVSDSPVVIHQDLRPGLLAALSGRFRATDRAIRFDRWPRADLLPERAETYSDPDRPLLRRGWRASAMPSLSMERR
jgi:hypothetical protein